VKFGGKYKFALGKNDFVEISKGFNIPSMRVEDKNELKKGIDEILGSTGPMLLDIIVNPDEKVPLGGV
jgi:thiamine pyrophosphate-dependent acetolactate synthase large subunit-like protein